jgi:hypothetical protein
MNDPLLVSQEVLKRPPGSTLFLISSFSKMETFYRVKEIASKEFSKVQIESNPLPKWTVEISEKLNTRVGEGTKILAFKRRIHREELPDIKNRCVKIRKSLLKSDETLRIIPGYLSSHNVITASVNDDFHRIYLYHGVYAEIIYKYEKLELKFIDTAPEFFALRDVMHFFKSLREYHVNLENKR